MLFFGVNGLGVVPAKQFGPSLMPSATSYKAPTTTDTPTTTTPTKTFAPSTSLIASVLSPTDTQGTRNPDSSSTPDTLTATPSTSPTDPTFGTGTYNPSSAFHPPPSTSTPPPTSSTTPPPSTSTPSPSSSSVDVGPAPSCPAGTMFDSGSHTCIGQGAGTFGATYPTPSYVGPTVVTTSGPTVVVDPSTTPPSMIPGAVDAHRRKRNVLFWLGVGMIALSAVVVARS